MKIGSASTLCVVLYLLGGSAASAQWFGGTANGNGSAAVMWGTQSVGLGSGGLEGATGHVMNGQSAGQVNAAKDGLLLGPAANITAVGVMNTITVTGDNNTVNGTQTGTNSGDISTSGRVEVKP